MEDYKAEVIGIEHNDLMVNVTGPNNKEITIMIPLDLDLDWVWREDTATGLNLITGGHYY